MEALNNLARLAPNVLTVFGRVRQALPAGASVTLTQQSGDVDTDQSQVTVTRNSAGNYTITINNAMVTGTTNAIALASISTTAIGFWIRTEEPTVSSNALSFVVETGTANVADCSFNFMVSAYTPL